VKRLIRRLPRRLSMRLLAYQYAYDRLNDRQRLVLGIVSIALCGAGWLYVLGITSIILVQRAEAGFDEPEIVYLAVPTIVVLEQPTAYAPPPPTIPRPTSTATPPIDPNDALIHPPDVPEVAIIPAPRYSVPFEPIKPRVVAPTATLAIAAATAVTPRVSRTPVPLTPPPLVTSRPLTTVTSGTPAITSPVSSTPVPTVARTPVPVATSTPARPAVATPVVPTLVPRATTAPTAVPAPARR
jgi:hypothetical protein